MYSKLSISDRSVIKIVGIFFTSMSEKSVPLSRIAAKPSIIILETEVESVIYKAKLERLFEIVKNVIDHFDETHNGTQFISYKIDDVAIDNGVLTISIKNDRIKTHKDSILVALKRECKDEQHNF